MGTTSSQNSESSHGGERQPEGGSQLYVSLRMVENLKMKSDLIPHVYGSSPIIGSWDASRSLPMEKDSPSMWELNFVVPSNHGIFPKNTFFRFQSQISSGSCPISNLAVSIIIFQKRWTSSSCLSPRTVTHHVRWRRGQIDC